jgi:hypothetical protein
MKMVLWDFLGSWLDVVVFFGLCPKNTTTDTPHPRDSQRAMKMVFWELPGKAGIPPWKILENHENYF